MAPRIESALTLMREAADRFVLPRFRRLEQSDIEEKSGPDDLVTAADKEAEVWLTSRLPALLPDSHVLGEEGATEDPGLFRLLEEPDPVWILDPVDGTREFVAGRETFGMMLALAQRGEVAFAVILTPVSDTAVLAEHGAGAWLWSAGNNRQVLRKAAGTHRLPTHGALNLRKTSTDWRNAIEATIAEHGIEVRDEICSAAEYTAMAQGNSEFVNSTMMMPWDHAPGSLILNETGGAVRDLRTGVPYCPSVGNAPHLIVADAEMWDPLAEEIRRHLKDSARKPAQ